MQNKVQSKVSLPLFLRQIVNEEPLLSLRHSSVRSAKHVRTCLKPCSPVVQHQLDRPVLLDVIKASKLLEQEKSHLSQQNLVLLLVHDVLLGKGIQAGDGPIKQAVLRHKTRMKAELVMIKVKRGIARDEDLAPQSLSSTSPRWIRINTNVSTKEAVTGTLRCRGFIHQHAVEE